VTAPVDSDRRPEGGPHDGQAEAVADRRWTALLAVAAGIVLVVAVVLRFVVSSPLWLDEALTVNIARLPLGDLHAALKRDGAPPLFYALLHFWTNWFGTSDVAVRALAGVFSIATFPALYCIGKRLGDRYTAWAAVLIFATLPYSIRFGSEARMYALVMFLVAWGYLAFVRAIERPTFGRLALVTLDVAALLYTHNWALYLLAVVGLLLIGLAWRGRTHERRRAALQVIVAMVVGGLLFLPWVPTLLYQMKHTGAPWGNPSLPWTGFTDAVGAFAGNAQKGGQGIANVLAWGLLVLALLAVFGRAIDRRHIELDLRTRPVVRWQICVAVGAMLLGLTLTYVSGNAFDPRHAAIAVPLLVVVVAVGIDVFTDRRLWVAVLAVVIALGLAGGVRNSVDDRTEAGDIAAAIEAGAKPGDIVVYCPDQLGPAVHRILGDDRGLVEVTFPRLTGPKFVNWIDYRDRIARTSPQEVADKLLKRAGSDATIWLVSTPGYLGFDQKCEELSVALGATRPGGLVVPNLFFPFYESMGLTKFGS
jgi:uncharacterized membrane protein